MVQQLVRALIETRGIHRVEDGVALAALEHRAAVDLVQAVGALELGAHQRVGLARAADAAGAAGHDLDQVDLDLAVFDLIEQLCRVGKAVGQGDAHVAPVNGDGHKADSKTDRWNLGNWLSGYWQTTYALSCQTEMKVIRADGKRVGFGNAF